MEEGKDRRRGSTRPRLAWLDRTLAARARRADAGVHPPSALRHRIAAHRTATRAVGGDDLAAVIARHPQVVRVIAGTSTAR
jgi:hypothetical protein